MGGKPSKSAVPPKEKQPQTEQQTLPDVPACDVVISYHKDDLSVTNFLKNGLNKGGLSAFVDEADPGKRAAGKAGAAIVQAKVFVLVLSPNSSKDKACNAEVSLAYISDKPIIPVSIRPKEDKQLLEHMDFGLKLTLEKMEWIFIPDMEEKEKGMDELIAKVKASLARAGTEVNVHEQGGSKPAGAAPAVSQVTAEKTSARITMHHTAAVATDKTLIQHETVGEDAQTLEGGRIRTFWDRQFENEDTVVWFRFQQALLNEYEERFTLLFGDDQNKKQWILKLLHQEVFSGKDELTRQRFMEFRGQRAERDLFWKRISQIALESYTMHEVFNMDSTVRLAAVENLGKFSSPAVIEALLDLLDDPDANIRAVAAISLGRTGLRQDRSVPRLIQSLEDTDRLVREACCLSLGHLKCTEAVPFIINRWRNDFISHVREAAHVALKNIGGEEANKAIHMTEVLTGEIRALTK